MSMMQRWRSTHNKDNMAFYENATFRDDYTEQELSPKQRMVRFLIKEPLTSAIMSTDIDSYEVLSLGCGPGSDLLAVMDVFQSVCYSENLGYLQVRCEGVDLFGWPQNQFERRKRDIEARGPIKHFDWEIYEKDMTAFINAALRAGKRFDFIILSFADAKSRIDFIGRKLPKLLYKGGRIFVIDNSSSVLRRLKNFGFREVGWANDSGVVCYMFELELNSSDSDY